MHKAKAAPTDDHVRIPQTEWASAHQHHLTDIWRVGRALQGVAGLIQGNGSLRGGKPGTLDLAGEEEVACLFEVLGDSLDRYLDSAEEHLGDLKRLLKRELA